MKALKYGALALAIAAVLFAGQKSVGNVIYNPHNEEFPVAKVVDGDTLRLSTGERVRLLNIDTPERGQYLWKEATERMKSLAGNMSVVLENDMTNKDKYGRLLRYVYVNDEMLNLIMVREGFARSYLIPPDEKHYNEVLKAEEDAKSKGLGIWKYDSITDAFCMWVYDFKPDPKGRDEDNLNGEYVVLRNSCSRPVNLSGWRVSGSRGSFLFSNFTVAGKEKLWLHSGPGSNNATDVYWGSAKPVWKNGADTLLAYNANSELVLNYSY